MLTVNSESSSQLLGQLDFSRFVQDTWRVVKCFKLQKGFTSRIVEATKIQGIFVHQVLELKSWLSYYNTIHAALDFSIYYLLCAMQRLGVVGWGSGSQG